MRWAYLSAGGRLVAGKESLGSDASGSALPSRLRRDHECARLQSPACCRHVATASKARMPTAMNTLSSPRFQAGNLIRAIRPQRLSRRGPPTVPRDSRCLPFRSGRLSARRFEGHEGTANRRNRWLGMFAPRKSAMALCLWALSGGLIPALAQSAPPSASPSCAASVQLLASRYKVKVDLPTASPAPQPGDSASAAPPAGNLSGQLAASQGVVQPPPIHDPAVIQPPPPNDPIATTPPPKPEAPVAQMV